MTNRLTAVGSYEGTEAVLLGMSVDVRAQDPLAIYGVVQNFHVYTGKVTETCVKPSPDFVNDCKVDESGDSGSLG